MPDAREGKKTERLLHSLIYCYLLLNLVQKYRLLLEIPNLVAYLF